MLKEGPGRGVSASAAGSSRRTILTRPAISSYPNTQVAIALFAQLAYIYSKYELRIQAIAAFRPRTNTPSWPQSAGRLQEGERSDD